MTIINTKTKPSIIKRSLAIGAIFAVLAGGFSAHKFHKQEVADAALVAEKATAEAIFTSLTAHCIKGGEVEVVDGHRFVCMSQEYYKFLLDHQDTGA